MLSHPLLASLLAFALPLLLVELTRWQRRRLISVHIAVLLIAVSLSVGIAAHVSLSPEASGGHLFFLWAGYAVINLFIRRKRERGAA
jgi:hypothetical protein